MPRKRQIKSAKQKKKSNRNSVKKSRKKVRKSRMSGGKIPKESNVAFEFINSIKKNPQFIWEVIKTFSEEEEVTNKDPTILRQYSTTFQTYLSYFVTIPEIRKVIKHKILKVAKDESDKNLDSLSNLIKKEVDDIFFAGQTGEQKGFLQWIKEFVDNHPDTTFKGYHGTYKCIPPTFHPTKITIQKESGGLLGLFRNKTPEIELSIELSSEIFNKSGPHDTFAIINFCDNYFKGEYFEDIKWRENIKIKTWFDAFEKYFKLYIVLVIFKELNINIDANFIKNFSI